MWLLTRLEPVDREVMAECEMGVTSRTTGQTGEAFERASVYGPRENTYLGNRVSRSLENGAELVPPVGVDIEIQKRLTSF